MQAFANDYSPIRHMAYSIHRWDSKAKFMLMLTSYMDETGHSEDPHFHFAGMAGFIAPLHIWEDFGSKWQGILDSFNLKEPFHMKDFAHFRGQFKNGWRDDKPKREHLFGQLVTTILDTKAFPMGAIISIEDFRGLSECQRKSFRDPYYVAFQTMTRGASIFATRQAPEKVAMVYSYNKEFGTVKPQETYSIDQAGNAEQLWHAIKDNTMFGQWMGSYASSSPAEMVQLQAADLFAYELAKEFENQLTRPNDDMRWGLQQILTLVPYPFVTIRLFDRLELLRTVKEGGFECQTGTSEINESQLLSARDKMVKWMQERGNFPRKVNADEL